MNNFSIDSIGELFTENKQIYTIVYKLVITIIITITLGLVIKSI